MKARHNPTEEEVRQLIVNTLKVTNVFESNATPYSIYLQQRKYKGTKIFTDAPSPHKTLKGNNRRTEYVVQSEKYGLDDRIDCKHLDTYNSIAGNVQFELDFIGDIPEKKYIIVIKGEGYENPTAIKQIKTAIKQKNAKKAVVMTVDELKIYLSQCKLNVTI